ADVVLVEGKERAEPGARQRGARAREPIIVQPAEIDPFLEIDLGMPRRLQRPVPAVMRIDVVGPDDFRRVPLLPCHRACPSPPVSAWSALFRDTTDRRTSRDPSATSAACRTCCAAAELSG